MSSQQDSAAAAAEHPEEERKQPGDINTASKVPQKVSATAVIASSANVEPESSSSSSKRTRSSGLNIDDDPSPMTEDEINAFNKLSLSKQLLHSKMRSGEQLELLVNEYRRDGSDDFVKELSSWDKKFLIKLTPKLKLNERTTAKLMREDILRLVKENAEAFASPSHSSDSSSSSSEPEEEKHNPRSNKRAPSTPRPNKSRRGSKSPSPSRKVESDLRRKEIQKKASSVALKALAALPPVTALATPSTASLYRPTGNETVNVTAKVSAARSQTGKLPLARYVPSDTEDSPRDRSRGSSSNRNRGSHAPHYDDEESSNRSSSSGDDDDLDRIDEEVERDDLGHQVRIAGSYLRDFDHAAGGATLQAFFKAEITSHYDHKNLHAKMEIGTLTMLIDIARRMQPVARSERLLVDDLLEVACRRLGGVALAADTGNWDVCNALQSTTASRSFLPARVINSAAKTVNRFAKLKKSASDSRSSSSRRSSNDSSFKGKRDRNRSSSSGDKGESESGARSSSYKKKESGSKKR